MSRLKISWLVLMCVLLVTVEAQASEYDVKKLRRLFEQSEKNEEVGEQFYELMKDYEGNDPVILAYKAAANAIEAKYSWAPWDKYKHIKRSSDLFNQAVSLDRNNTEVRFLRFTIETLTPHHLNMSTHLTEDKKFIMEQLRTYPNSGITPDTKPLVVNFMLKHVELTQSERALLYKLKS
ncbi:MAG: hypothetical protein LPJ89_01660 [Hymenobacteraceae bacterium]|nr:hypothetical protein [Hymenobacteraceae bacterium]MDX5396489.1 hypothetical protein [Hymenobacteraceae bacterium]MDX5442469.1 hypothetical protein [Hymenobacteraceae bacterium]MDX5512547.1 hypothetical protein [Hymenobacteraceae bacterium]